MGGGGGRARESEDEWASTTHLVSSLRTSHHRHRLKSQLALVDARGILFVICWEISLSTEELCASERDWSGGGRRTSLTESKWRIQISATSKEVTRRRVRWTLKFESDSNVNIVVARYATLLVRRQTSSSLPQFLISNSLHTFSTPFSSRSKLWFN